MLQPNGKQGRAHIPPNTTFLTTALTGTFQTSDQSSVDRRDAPYHGKGRPPVHGHESIAAAGGTSADITSPPTGANRTGGLTTKWGMGVRHTLFPVPTLGAALGCRLPDAILHGKRSCRPRSRAVQNLAASGLLSEAFQLASTGGCATDLQTRSTHVCDLHLRVLTT